MRKKWLLSVLALALLALAAGLFVAWNTPPRLTQEQYDRISVGMTLEEVEAILKCPPGVYSQSDVLLPLDKWISDAEKPKPQASHHDWAADTTDPVSHGRTALVIRVFFDDEGRVIDKYRVYVEYSSEPGFLERVLRSVGL